MASETMAATAVETTTEDWQDDDGACDANISRNERIASLVGGAGLVAYGLTRRSWGGVALALLGGSLLHRGATQHCFVYGAMGVDTSGHEHDHDTSEEQSFAPDIPVKHGLIVEQTVTIDKPRAELYSFWRNFENLPRFMNHLQEVRVLDDKRSHWVAKAPAGQTVEWDAAITDEREGEVIAWHSEQGATVHNTGSVRFHDKADGSGTEVKVVIQYKPPAGALGAAIAKMWGEEPNQQVSEDLHRFKQLMETGDVPTPDDDNGE